jgi:uncharacterized protein (TIGR03000 family)
MAGIRRTLKKEVAFLASPVMLFAAGLSLAQAGDWGSYLHVGPARNPDGSYADYSHSALPPDSLPPPPSSYFWPTWREAVDQYGWFGRRACNGCAGGTPTFARISEPQPTFDPPQPEQMPLPSPAGSIRVIVPASASVWLDGQLTPQTGPVRLFAAPLQPGSGPTHEIKARWWKGGKEIRGGQQIRTEPGQRVTVDFVTPALEKGR